MPSKWSTLPTELAVVGESKNDPEQLLCLGPEGTYYAYSLPDGESHLVDPDEYWEVEPASTEELFT